MDDKSVRLECLKLASNQIGFGVDLVTATASVYFDFVTGRTENRAGVEASHNQEDEDLFGEKFSSPVKKSKSKK